MSFRRRQFLHLAAGAAALPAMSRTARAQAYPSRPVRWIVPFAAGGVPDIIARLLGDWLSVRLGQPFLIENRPSVGGIAGTEAVVRAPADGYTLLSVAAGSMISASRYRNLTFDFLRDIAPVASIGRFPHAIAVHPSVPVSSLQELVQYARTHPGRLNEGSLSGASVHLVAELFKMATSADITHVPYRSGAMALADTLSGQLQVSFDIAGVLAEFAHSEKLRVLAVTTPDRWEGLPDIPSVSEHLPDFQASSAGGVGVPRATSSVIVNTLNREINAGLADNKIRARLVGLGATLLVGSPSDFGRLVAEEVERWGKAIRSSNLRPD